MLRSASSFSVRQLKRVPGLGISVSTFPGAMAPSTLPRCHAAISPISVEPVSGGARR
ncbi:MAG: hypothetical protein U1E38_00525 [Rhodospirillales bacterium]